MEGRAYGNPETGRRKPAAGLPAGRGEFPIPRLEARPELADPVRLRGRQVVRFLRVRLEVVQLEGVGLGEPKELPAAGAERALVSHPPVQGRMGLVAAGPRQERE